MQALPAEHEKTIAAAVQARQSRTSEKGPNMTVPGALTCFVQGFEPLMFCFINGGSRKASATLATRNWGFGAVGASGLADFGI